MSYTPTSWVNGELVSAADMNHIEQGIADTAAGGATDPAFAAVIADPVSATRVALDAALRARGPLLAEEYGITGNGTADEGAVLTTLLASAASTGRVVRLPPKGVIRSTTAILVPSGARINGNGATIKNAMTSTSGRVVTISGVTNVVISDLTVDGDKANFAGVTEQRHNVHMVNSSQVVLTDVVSKNAKGDGLYIGDDPSGLSSDVTLRGVTCTGNHRNGLSISSAVRVRGFGCSFTLNGGTSPMSGLDIEPNTDAATCSDIAFHACDFSQNGYDGVIVQAKSAAPTGRQAGASFTDCTAVGNGTAAAVDFGNGVQFRWVKNVSWVGGSIRDNLRRGVWVRDTCAVVTIDSTIEANGREGIGQAGGGSDIVTDLTIRGFIWGNGLRDATAGGSPQAAALTDGVGLAGAGSRLRFEATSGGAQQRYGLRTLGGWSAVGVGSGARFPSNGSGTASLGDDYSSRTVTCADLGWRVGRANATDVGFATRITGDTVDRFNFRQDGRLQWSTGAAAIDVTFERLSAGTVGVGAAHAIRTGRGVTGSRPSASTVGSGASWFDTSLGTSGKPIWSTGSAWVDATGATV